MHYFRGTETTGYSSKTLLLVTATTTTHGVKRLGIDHTQRTNYPQRMQRLYSAYSDVLRGDTLLIHRVLTLLRLHCGLCQSLESAH
jgi:hypothetical protein